jgi:hypothetical protein
MNNLIALVAVAALALVACGKKDKDKESKSTATTAPDKGKRTVPAAPRAVAPMAKPPAAKGPTMVTGFKTPESVFYDADGDPTWCPASTDPFATSTTTASSPRSRPTARARSDRRR